MLDELKKYLVDTITENFHYRMLAWEENADSFWCPVPLFYDDAYEVQHDLPKILDLAGVRLTNRAQASDSSHSTLHCGALYHSVKRLQ